MIAFRDRRVKELGCKLIIHINESGLRAGINPFTSGLSLHTDVMKTQALKQALDKFRFDAAFGGLAVMGKNHAPRSGFFHSVAPNRGGRPNSDRPLSGISA
jgi:sulfate adenylyltransferase subunit 2